MVTKDQDGISFIVLLMEDDWRELVVMSSGTKAESLIIYYEKTFFVSDL